MSNFLKVLIIVGIAAVIVAVIVMGQMPARPGSGPRPDESTTSAQTQQTGVPGSGGEETATLPRASGDVDAAVDVFLLETASEQSAVDQELNDAALLDSDSQALSNYGSSYVESEF